MSLLLSALWLFFVLGWDFAVVAPSRPATAGGDDQPWARSTSVFVLTLLGSFVCPLPASMSTGVPNYVVFWPGFALFVLATLRERRKAAEWRRGGRSRRRRRSQRTPARAEERGAAADECESQPRRARLLADERGDGRARGDSMDAVADDVSDGSGSQVY